MLIEEVTIKGFKSFGNQIQTIKLNREEGELILIVGSNGNGKSSLIESFEYCLYGKVKSGKSKKWHKLSTLPNRINKELLNTIKFKTSSGVEVEVKRGIGPNLLELWENGVLNEKAGKSNIDEKIEGYVGMDVETFKSFISLSINDFKNFISLSNEEKQLLLDKLFNLEVINILNSILKELVKSNNLRKSSLESEMNTLQESIDKIRASIEKAIQKEKENISQEIETIKQDMDSKKEEFTKLKEKIEKIKSKTTELELEVDQEKTQYSSIQNDLRNVSKDLDLYDSGKCPTCATSFESQYFLDLRETLKEKKDSLANIKDELENNIKSLKEKQKKLKDIAEDANEAYNDIVYYLKSCKQKIDKLEQKQNDAGKSSYNIEEFTKTIEELEDKKEVSNDKFVSAREKDIFYKELNKIFGEEGVKKSIIAGMIKPINHFIKEYSKKMFLKFDIVIDETFTAEIRHLGEVVDHETLSTGETKRINLIILIAYITLIRTKKFINILFLDEVFSSIDLEGVDDILRLLKAFAADNKINIFVVHHAILNQENFDRIIKVNKEVFTYLEEITVES